LKRLGMTGREHVTQTGRRIGVGGFDIPNKEGTQEHIRQNKLGLYLVGGCFPESNCFLEQFCRVAGSIVKQCAT
jgi:hypothetical protein